MNNNKNQIRTDSRSLALVSMDEARNIAIKAMPSFSDMKDRRDYIAANHPTVYLMVNVWIMLVYETSERTAYALKRSLLQWGLPYTIKQADEIANAIIHQASDLSKMDGYAIWFDVFSRIGENPDVMRRVLELLRFPKRYSPAYQKDVEDDGIRRFLEVNRTRRFKPGQQKSVDQYMPRVKFDDNYFIKDIQLEVDKILDHGFYHDLMSMSPSQAEAKLLSMDWCRFSNGATAELNYQQKTFLQKLKNLKKFVPYYKDRLYPWSSKVLVPRAWDWCKVCAVPKSYKTPRIIAKEPTWRNYIATGLRIRIIQDLQKFVPDLWKQFDVETQENNRDVAWTSSFNQKYATVDITSASDSIPAGLGCTLFKLFEKVAWLRASYMEVNGDLMPNNIFLTSGHPLTFLCETIFFYAVAIVATKYTKLFYDKRNKFVEPFVFGDDTAIDCRALELFITILDSFGVTVNVEKSFTAPSDYRESCGVEYYKGYPMHGVKWPRTTFDWTCQEKYPEYVASLITLQRALFSRSWRISDFLTENIRHYEPLLTVSKPNTGDGTIDLWSDYDSVTLRRTPGADKETDGALHFPSILKTDKGFTWTYHEKSTWVYYGSEVAHKWLPARVADSGLAIMGWWKKHWDKIPPKEFHGDILWDATHREVHSVLKPQYNEAKLRDMYDPDLELALYVDFLQYGPHYLSKLDELLHVSSPVDRKPLVAVPKNRWVTTSR